MIRDLAPERPSGPVRPDYRAVGAVALFAYLVVLGDIAWRDIHPGARILSALLAGGVVMLYVTKAPSKADRFDRMVLLALLVFSVPCVFSKFPRQSLDAMLGALLSVSALFVARGILQRESARRLFIAGLMALSALLTIATAAQVIVPFLEWWALTGWTVMPPLDLKIVPEPWGFRYEMATFLLLLYPSWWVGRITRLRVSAAVIIGILVIAVCVIVGSRAVWLATGGGLAAIAIPILKRGFRWDYRLIAITGTTLAVLALLLVVAGLTGSLGERVFRAASIAERGTEWGPLLHAWAERPAVGYGAGSFPWLLQLTDYFDTNSFSPRQPDNAAIQLLVESGVVGLVAVLIVLATVLPAVFRGRSHAARFAVVVYLLAGIGTNPSEFGFLVGAGIIWVAFACPRRVGIEPPVESTNQSRSPWLRGSTLGALVTVSLAFGATIAADSAYSVARGAIARSELRIAEASLELATALDPGMALYSRQLGTLRLVSGDPRGAIPSLQRAARLNASDDLAWRVLGLAYAEAGDNANSRGALERAVEVQRSDPTNLLLMVRALRIGGSEGAATEVLSEVVQAWPMIVAAPVWGDFISPTPTLEVLRLAHHRWVQGLPSPEPHVSQSLLLGVMIGLSGADLDNEPTWITSTLKEGYVAITRCDSAGDAALGGATAADRRQPTYWALATRLARVEGRPSDDYERLYRIMTGDPLLRDRTFQALNPLHENGIRGSSADLAGYRRPPIEWPNTPWDLPSPRAGFARWHLDPGEASREATLEAVLHDCQTR